MEDELGRICLNGQMLNKKGASHVHPMRLRMPTLCSAMMKLAAANLMIWSMTTFELKLQPEKEVSTVNLNLA
jgi:hypothetical protein